MVSSLDSDTDIKRKILTESAQWLKDKELVFNEKSVESVKEFTNVVSTFFKQNKNDAWLFRGESHLFEKPLVPSLLRDDIALHNTKCPDKTITDIEIEEIESCQESLNAGEIKDRYLKAFLPIMHNKDVNWLPLARHFGYKTRLLDVTVNPLVALYFACSTLHEGPISDDDDAFVYAFLSGNFRPVNSRNQEQTTSSDFPPIPISYLELYDIDTHFRNDFDELPYIFEPNIPQERLQAQAGRFLFWRSLKPVLYDRQIIPIRINASEKLSILNELTAFGITEHTLFPSEA